MDEDELSSLLSRFKCSRNKDSEFFLKKISVKHETKDISRTYLAIDPEKDKISGYFTLALKCLNVDGPDVDPAVVEMMNLKGDVAQAYMIGQLARSDDAMPGLGRSMLDHALKRFSVGKEMFGCRMVRLDCKDELIGYYRSCGFQHIRKNAGRNLNQMAIFI
jgi:ribosomal protein S18 acetylase RimI-like enzyme